MDKSLHKYSGVREMKAAEYRYWQGLPAHKRVDAAWDISAELYELKGETPDAQRLQKNLVRLSIKECKEPGEKLQR